MPKGKAMIAAASRFKEAWERAMAHNGEGLIVSDLDMVEVHQAALELIQVTGTNDLEEALAVLGEFDP